MITGSEKESRSLMMNAAIKIVAERGFEGFTTKRWAATAGVAEGSLYYHFKSKDDLLEQAFFYIDQEIVGLYSDASDAFRKIRDLKDLKDYLIDGWKRYYYYLVEHPQKTVFYYRYLTSPRCNEKIQKSRMSYVLTFQKRLEDTKELRNLKDKINPEVLWMYIANTAVSFAFGVVTGAVENKKETVSQMLDLSMYGLSGVLSDAEKEQ